MLLFIWFGLVGWSVDLIQFVPASHDTHSLYVRCCERCMSSWNKSHTIDGAFNQWVMENLSPHSIEPEIFITSFWQIYMNHTKPQPHLTANDTKVVEKKKFAMASHLSYHKITANELPSNVNSDKNLLIVATRENPRHIERERAIEKIRETSNAICKNCFSRWLVQCYFERKHTRWQCRFVAFKNWKIM